MSTRTVPGFAPASAPSVPRNTSRTSFGKPTMAKTTSDCSATCFGLSAAFAPSSSSGCELVLAAVVDRRGEALLHRVLAHPPAHDAGADPADAGFSGLSGRNCHGRPLAVFSGTLDHRIGLHGTSGEANGQSKGSCRAARVGRVVTSNGPRQLISKGRWIARRVISRFSGVGGPMCPMCGDRP